MRKSIICIVILCYLLAIIGIPVYATNEKQEFDKDSSYISPEMIEILRAVALGNGRMFNAKGKDVTDEFLTKYSDLFNAEDYAGIQKMCFDEVIVKIESNCDSCLYESNSTIQANETTHSFSQSKAHLVVNNGTLYNGKTWYLIVTASGTYQGGYAPPNVNYVTSASVSNTSFSFSGEGTAFTGSVTDVSTSTPVISSNATSFSFYIFTTHIMVGPSPSAYLPITLGPFSHIFSYTISV